MVRRYGAAVGGQVWIWIGLIALVLMVSAELLLAVVLAGRGVGEYIAGRDPIAGSGYLAMLALFGAMPWLRRRSGRGDSPTQPAP